MAIKKYLSLPKGYLSYSQYCLWTSNPEKYKLHYFDGRKDDYTNSGQVFGKQIADALEAKRDTGDLLTDSAMLLLPKYDVMDQSFFTEFKERGGRWLKIICKPDTFNSVSHAFRETKSGTEMNPWTQTKAQNHVQLLWYAVGIWLKYGTMNTNAHLDWIVTEKLPGGNKPTGRVESFEVTFTPADYYEFQAKMLKVAYEIEEAWAAHESKPWVTTF